VNNSLVRVYALNVVNVQEFDSIWHGSFINIFRTSYVWSCLLKFNDLLLNKLKKISLGLFLTKRFWQRLACLRLVELAEVLCYVKNCLLVTTQCYLIELLFNIVNDLSRLRRTPRDTAAL